MVYIILLYRPLALSLSLSLSFSVLAREGEERRERVVGRHITAVTHS